MTSAINWKDSVKRSNNNPQLAQDLLNMLSLELPDFKRLISNAVTENNRQELQAQIHKLHGACCYCGANDLKAELIPFESTQWVNQLDHATLKNKVSAIQQQIDRTIKSLSTKDYL